MRLSKTVLSELFVEALMEYIEQEDLRPGDFIPTENELATLFGISRTSIREGIMKLRSIGILSSTGRLKLQAISIDDFLRPKEAIRYERFLEMESGEVLELLAIRRIYECFALDVAMQTNYRELLTNLKRLLVLLERHEADVDKFIEYDAEFHRQILIASRNTILVKLYDFSWSFLYRKQFEETSRISGAVHKAVQYHRNIVSFIEKRDSESAKRELEEHLDDMLHEFEARDGFEDIDFPESCAGAK